MRGLVFFSTVEMDTESEGFIFFGGGGFYQHFDKIGHKKRIGYDPFQISA